MTATLSMPFSALPCAHAHGPMPAKSISGRVVEEGLDDYGVPEVTVRIEGTERVVITNEDGVFFIFGAPRGPVTLIFEAPDYITRRVEIFEGAPGPITVSMVFEGEAITQVTTQTRRADPETASTTRLGRRAISAAPRRNAEEVLRQVPGLTLVQHGSEGKGHQFFMRGFDAIHGADLALTLDGLPVNEWSNVHAQGYLDLSVIIPEMIHEVAVTKGPFTLEQGAFGMAGSAEYRLSAPEEALGWTGSYTAGTTNRHRAFVGYSPRDADGEQFASAEAIHDDGFGDNRRIDRAAFNGRVRLLDLDDAGSLYLTTLGSFSAFELPGTLRNKDVEDGFVDFYDAYDPLAEGTSARALVSLRHDQRGDNHALSITGYGGYRWLELLENYTGFLIDPVHGDRRVQSQETWSFGAFGSHDSTLLEQLSLHLRAGVRGDVFSQREDNVGQLLEQLTERRALDGFQFMANTSAGVTWSPHQRVRLDAGGRVDLVRVNVTDLLDDGARGDDTMIVASPRATGRWDATDSLRLFAAYGRGFRPPEARAFSSFDPSRVGLGDEVLADATPSMTVSDAFELGTRWRPSSWFGASLSGFATVIERESIFDHVSGVSVELNGTRRLGGELVLTAAPLPWLDLSADVTVVDARFTESGNKVPLAPWLTSGVHATVTHERGFRAGLRALAVAPRPLPHGATGSTLLMTDATLGYHWRWLRVGIELENILGRQLREGEYHYASHWRRDEPASELPALHTTAGPPFNARLTVGAQL